MDQMEKIELLKHAYMEGEPSFLEKCRINPTETFFRKLDPDTPVFLVFVFTDGSEKTEFEMPYDTRMYSKLRLQYMKDHCSRLISITARQIDWKQFPENFFLTDCMMGNLPMLRKCCRWDAFCREEDPKKKGEKVSKETKKRIYITDLVAGILDKEQLSLSET